MKSNLLLSVRLPDDGSPAIDATASTERRRHRHARASRGRQRRARPLPTAGGFFWR